MKLLLIASFFLISCTKTTLTETKILTVQEFKSMLHKENIYQITEYTDTLGTPLPYDTNDRTIFEASTKERNGRIYNEVNFTICFAYWAAYEHSRDGYIVFEWVDFDLTPTYYRVLDYNIEQGWFVVKGENRVIKYFGN